MKNFQDKLLWIMLRQKWSCWQIITLILLYDLQIHTDEMKFWKILIRNTIFLRFPKMFPHFLRMIPKFSTQFLGIWVFCEFHNTVSVTAVDCQVNLQRLVQHSGSLHQFFMCFHVSSPFTTLLPPKLPYSFLNLILENQTYFYIPFTVRYFSSDSIFQ